ncbi:MAG: GGDEF domain-containing protein [Pseudomonas sp.]|uniref:diguanylate cyclase domain-containing protein n=1 Tax=Pseudomonas sp. TaxID=306 RepID=UPI003397396B
MRFGIGFKLASLMAGFGILVTGLTGYYSYVSSHAMLLKAAEQSLLSATQVLGRNLVANLDNVSKDVRVLASLAQATSPLGNLDTGTTERIETELSDTFRSLLKVHPEYVQIRLISSEWHGLERVRVDRDGALLTRVTGQDLQEKAHLPYVFETLRLPGGAVRLSQILINHEEGAHSGLNRPSLQVSTPVVDDAARVRGLIVINIDLHQLFTQLKNDLPDSYQLYLSNHQGDFLIHPDPQQTFGFERGRRILIQEQFPDVARLFKDKRRSLIVKASAPDAPDLVAAFERLPFGESERQGFVILGLSQPTATIVEESGVLGRRIIQIVAALSLLASLLAVLVARAFTGPLNAMVAAMQRFSSERVLSSLPLQRSDEIGLLAHNFHEMQTEILKHLDALNLSRSALDHLSQHDPLTGLPNRRLFLDRLEHALATARRSGKALAVLFVDLDHFKAINDTFGHSLGDGVLKKVSALLTSATREVDTVARWGGDEFVILFDAMDDPRHVLAIVQKLHMRFQSSMLIDGRELKIQASIGVSLYPIDGNTAESLIQQADRAMYNAKKDGRNTFTFFDQGA